MRKFAMLLTVFAMGCNEASKSPSTTSTSPPSHTAAPSANGSAPHVSGAHASGEGTVATEPDNTAVNDRDRDSTAKTPIDQNENSTDVKITADIRKRVVDSEMSTDAKNSKIITQDGKVTLRGPVDSEDEKENIQKIAVEVAGEGNVENLLEVKAVEENQTNNKE